MDLERLRENGFLIGLSERQKSYVEARAAGIEPLEAVKRAYNVHSDKSAYQMSIKLERNARVIQALYLLRTEQPTREQIIAELMMIVRTETAAPQFRLGALNTICRLRGYLAEDTDETKLSKLLKEL